MENPFEVIDARLNNIEQCLQDILKALGLPKNKAFLKDLTLDDLHLSVRCYNCLKALRCDSVSELINLYSVDDLLKYRNVGHKAVDEFRMELANHGLKLKGE